MSMQKVEKSLEDIFLELTGESETDILEVSDETPEENTIAECNDESDKEEN